MLATVGGAKAALFNRWNADKALATIRKHKLTSGGGVPFVRSASLPDRALMVQMVGELVEAAKRTPEGTYTGMQSFLFGGSPASSSLPGAATKAFIGAMPAQGYGATETNSACVGIAGEDYLRRSASTGLATLVNDVKIADDDGNELPRGQMVVL